MYIDTHIDNTHTHYMYTHYTLYVYTYIICKHRHSIGSISLENPNTNPMFIDNEKHTHAAPTTSWVKSEKREIL